MSSNQIPRFTNKTFAQVFDELFNFAKELYRYPESLCPSMKKEKLPLEAFMKGVRILLSHTPRQHPNHHKPPQKSNLNTHR